MNIAFTMTVAIDGEFVLQRGDGVNQIPSGINVRAITFWPQKDTTYPIYYVKGIHEDSSYIKVEAEMPIHAIDGITDDVNIYGYIKTTSSVTFNFEVKGRV